MSSPSIPTILRLDSTLTTNMTTTTPSTTTPALSVAELNADLDALQRLPPNILDKLIDPSARPRPRPADAETQLAAFNESSGPDASLALTTAYANEMRQGAARLKAQEIGSRASGAGVGADLAKLERIRAVAEEVRAAVDDYAQEREK